MSKFLDPLAGQHEVPVGRCLCLLDEGVNHHDAFAEQKAVQGTANA